MIETNKIYNGSIISYEIVDDGYNIYLGGKLWVSQNGEDYRYPDIPYEEACLKQIDKLCGASININDLTHNYIPIYERGNINGVVALDEDGVVDPNQITSTGLPPLNVDILDVSYTENSITIKWKDPEDLYLDNTLVAKWQGTRVLYKTGDYPINKEDGIIAGESEIRNQYSETGLTITNLTPGTTYYIRVMPYTTQRVYNMEDVGKIEIAPEKPTVYGFHIDSKESDPSNCVTYLEDAIGMTPASMNYSTGVFDYGSWEDAFFMPRPCMLKFNCTVDYYLDPNDYSKKEDGTPSDIANINYGGNAMMEWGRYSDRERIWMKIVPDASDNTSYSVYISNMQVDENYHAWSFINSKGELTDHFYTAIYTCVYDDNYDMLKSISGMDNAVNNDRETEISYAKNNNSNISSSNVQWYTETYADRMLINMLLVLMGKSLDTQTVYGYGNCSVDTNLDTYSIKTGTMDQKGLFWGSNNTVDTTEGVKVFGMENYWGNIFRACAGLINVQGQMKIKLTYGTQDGSTGTGYNTTGDGYINVGTPVTVISNSYMRTQVASSDGYVYPSPTSGGSDSTYYCDIFYQNYATTYYAEIGGAYGNNAKCGAFYIELVSPISSATVYRGIALSCRP